MQSLFPLLLQYGPGSPAGLSIHPASFLLWMSPALAAQALPPSHGTCAPGEGRWPGRGAARGEGLPGAGCDFCGGFSGTVLGVCQDGCQLAPGHG